MSRVRITARPSPVAISPPRSSTFSRSSTCQIHSSAREIVPLDVAQVRAVAEGMPDRWRAIVAVAAGTGLRQGELLGLTVDRVDFLRRQLRVDRQLVTVGTGPTAIRFGEPKTQASYRTIPLPAVVVDVLSAHLAEFGSGDDGLIFSTSEGGPIRRQRMADAWRKAATAAGLDESVKFHDLRHFYPSLLIRHGESVKVVQARLGHASAAETLDTYAHLWPDDEDRTRAAVDEGRGGRGARCRARGRARIGTGSCPRRQGESVSGAVSAG